jgi:hypothetical protein
MRPLFLLLFSFLLVGAFSPAGAQHTESNGSSSPGYTEGFFLNLRAGGRGLTVEDDEADLGKGIGAKLGYGPSPGLTLYLGGDVAGLNVADPNVPSLPAERYTLILADLGAQFNFRAESGRAIPYLEAALTGIISRYETDGERAVFSGSGGSFGGGLKYFVAPALALDGGLRFTFGKYRQLEVGRDDRDVDLNLSSAQLDVGLTFYLSR